MTTSAAAEPQDPYSLQLPDLTRRRRQCVVTWPAAEPGAGCLPDNHRSLPTLEVLVRPISLLLSATFIGLAAVVGVAGPAAAHTGFESSNPSDGASFDQPVDTITLIFTGEAEPTGTGFQVLDPTGELREPIEATSPDGSTWVLRFDPPLAGGTIGVRWTVRAPDAHPIGGSFSFDVTAAPALPDTALVSGGVPSASAQGGPDADAELTQASPIGSASAAGLEDFLDASEDPTAIPRRLGAAARVVTLFGTLVGVGALIFAAAVLRGERRDVRHVLHWVRRAGVLVVLGATAELIAQIGVEGAGDWSGLASPSTLRAVVASTFGIAIALRLAGGLAGC